MTISKGIAIIIASTILCLFFATSADMSRQELGALVNFVWPPALGIMAIIIFLLTS